ncbi:Wobble nucleotide-excising tRNase [Microbacterium sp. LKL04]|uniref:AAA family ATPase n=1 Tax=Microbacterium sp. LKL04 TaxID=912630 RepID=UPI000875BC78|nr:AAA family ATPase [Microbacterium sp. LKL04]SCY56101.1 Wobble nucleotide-excising tRNase [Microbacterium sp. LKL04]
MTRAQITRFRKIGKYRVFENWGDESRPKDLARVNLIYGTNGSGKSTLANILHACSIGAPDVARAGIEFDVLVDGVQTVVTEAAANFWPRVRVFNSDYVRENLKFDDVDGPRSDSLLTLGKANVDAEQELADAENRRTEIEPAAAAARAEAKAADKSLQQRMTEVAGYVVDDLRSSPVATYRGTNAYTRANVRALLAGDRSVFDGASTDLPADRKLATSDALPSFTNLQRPRFPALEIIQDESIALLTTDVTARPLARLANDPPRAQWVQEGLALHEQEENCSFCGNHITDTRRSELAAHFDRSIVDLQERIDEHLRLLDQASRSSGAMAESIPRDADLYPDLAGNLRSARTVVRDQVDRFQSLLLALSAALAAKRANPFVSGIEKFDLVEIPTADAVISVIDAHEQRRSEHVALASAAARRVELARVKGIIDEYDSSASRLHELNEHAAALESELKELSSRVIALRNLDADPVPQAAELTSSVTRLLGRSDLAFTPSEDGKQYRIERAGSPATHLSEGERTAIALLHFLASIREGVVSGDEPIIVIDDPVSSMDDGILFGVSSFLWSSLVESTYASQIMLLTHNFELFRQWVMQLESAGRHVVGGFTIHEIRMRHRSRGASTPRRLPQLDPWTENQQQSRRLRSLYHFLFARVAESVLAATPEMSLAERMDVLALAPNAARKMIEAFLSFRFPQHIGSFHSGMKAAIRELDDPAIRTHVERYLHAYSHNEEGNISAIVDPSEATVVLRSLFLMMRANDARHFSAMCEALGIDEPTLFALPR